MGVGVQGLGSIGCRADGAPWSDRSAGVAAAIAIGDRTGLSEDDEERLAGRGDVSRHRDLRREHRDSDPPPARRRALASRPATIWRSHRDRRAAGLWSGHRTCPVRDRAIAAAVLFLAGRLLELRGPSINILAVAAILGLSLSPAAVFDPGFLLSFGATSAF